QTKTTEISPKCNVGTEGENKPDGTSASNGKTLTEEGKRTNLKTDGRQPTELDNNSNEKTRLEKETKQPGSNEISQKSNVGTNCEIKPDETSASNGKTLSAEEKVLSLESDGRQPAETDKNSNGETKLEKETKNQIEKAHTGDDTRAHANNETDGQRSPFSSIGDGIDVVFHILIPTSIISNSEKVFLIVGLKEYGGWKSRQNELHLVSKRTDYAEMHITLKMRRFELERYIYYKYAVASNSNTEDLCEWENYHCHSHINKHNNRTLYVPSRMSSNKGKYASGWPL
ncbi:uncharacterized protein LOC128551410, partial [Mercenaria mercenaria]|uniref:uncharacterized protein LOC128551410 n=1 Tax=Mercenaria mercenaria TaxID=6596 RepID=UPI00234EE9DA